MILKASAAKGSSSAARRVACVASWCGRGPWIAAVVSGDGRLAQHRADLVLGELVLLEVLVEDGVVVLDDRLEHLVAQLGDPRLERDRDRPLDVLLPQRLVVVHDLHLTDRSTIPVN